MISSIEYSIACWHGGRHRRYQQANPTAASRNIISPAVQCQVRAREWNSKPQLRHKQHAAGL